jgi:DNA-binding SARP family transcriptional activator
MKFRAYEYSPDHRSGLDLTPDGALEIKDNLDLQFHLRLEPNQSSYFGLVFRMIFGEQNIDLMHKPDPDSDDPNNFHLILGDQTSKKIAFQIPIEELMNDWLHLRFELDFRKEKIVCFVNEKALEDDLININSKEGFHLMFGAHNFSPRLRSNDIPGMIIRDVEVKSSDKFSYKWPLNEIEGTRVHSEPQGQDGFATDPEWLLKRHNTWKKRLELELDGVIKMAYDARKDNLYIVTQDQMIVYDVVSKLSHSIELAAPSPVSVITELIFDTISNSLICYSLDNQYISTFDFETKQFSSYSPGELDETVYWHHNRFVAPDGTLISLGGYGHFTYKNSLLAWDPETEQFQNLTFSGTFHPRYLAGAGYNSKDGQYYVLGGYGSESGEQTESPDYYYDIVRFNLADRCFSTVYEFTDTQMEFCFASSLVFDEANNMYALSFSKYQFDNQLQLVRISLDKPELIQLGNAIDYSFLDISSQADLFYCQRTAELIAVSSYNADNSSSLSLHSIAFPLQLFISQTVSPDQGKPSILWYLGGALLVLIAAFIAIRRAKKRDEHPQEAKPAAAKHEIIQKPKENSIILFGGFQVIDKSGKDITAKFTPLPKKLFLFILLHSLRNNKGVSSNTMYETFWFDKSVESARNNRAVNIVKLKSLLENVDTASISKETGYWKLDFDPSLLYVDYLAYLQIVNSGSEPTREDMVSLLNIVENKPFLNNTNADWLDPYKSEVSNQIIDTFLKYLENSEDDPEFLLHLTKCIFIFDAVSEEALRVQCRLLIKQGKHSLARQAYSSFIHEYKQLYDEDYGLSFSQVIDET